MRSIGGVPGGRPRVVAALVAVAVLLTGTLIGPWSASTLSAQEAADDSDTATQPVSFHEQIRPILQEHCLGCHQPAKPLGEYSMTDFGQLVSGGESGEPAVVPGDPDSSYLMQQITVFDGEAEMPKDAAPLTADQIALIGRWIEEGATNDAPMSTQSRYDMSNPPAYAAPPVITSLDYSPDGSLLAVSGYHEVVLHRTDGTGIAARLVGISERIESAVFSPGGERIAVTGGSPGRFGELQVWNVERAELELSVTVGFDTVYGVSWSKDGARLAFGCPDNTIRVVEAATGNQVLYNGAHDNWVLDTVFSVDSQHLVSVSRDRSMKLIHVPTERFVDNITSITPGALKGGLHAVDRHPEKDELLVGGADGIPKIYRMFREQARRIGDDFNLIKAYPAMQGRLFDVEFSADGSRFVAGSSLNGRGQVRIYGVEDAQVVMEYLQQDGGVYAVAFHPDNQQVAAAGFDGRVRILNAEGSVTAEYYPVPLEAAATAPE